MITPGAVASTVINAVVSLMVFACYLYADAGGVPQYSFSVVLKSL